MPQPLRRLMAALFGRCRRAGAALVSMVLVSLTVACSGSENALPPLEVSARHQLPANDRPETGWQGQVPLEQQLLASSREGYRRGLRGVGFNSVGGTTGFDRGGNHGLAWIEECAYVGTKLPVYNTEAGDPGPPPEPLPDNGVAVIDARIPRRPELRGLLQDGTATHNAADAMEASEASGLLVISGAGRSMDVYAAPADCSVPTLLASLELPLVSRGLALSPDGRTAYVSSVTAGDPALAVIDLSQPDSPEILTTFGELPVNDLSVGPAGNRLYLAGAQDGGLRILDATAIQERAASPTLAVISELTWQGYAHGVTYFEIEDAPYVLATDSSGSDGNTYGYARVIDIADESAPVEISKIVLEIQEPEQSMEAQQDAVPYSAHFPSVAGSDLGVIEFTYWGFISWNGSGLRVFRLNDPANPGEYAYYNPAVVPFTSYKPSRPDGPLAGINYEITASAVRFMPQREQIWLVSSTFGFQIVQFTQTAEVLP